jgi:adenosylcobinamide kinase / adenosylcobinamide-phosphate guanylyltransferase
VSGQVTLILGGARSGKSACAERLAGESGRPVLYVATATAGDEEMAARIATHRRQRPAGWRTIEASHELLPALRTSTKPGDAVLIDCLTLWVSNVMLREIGGDSGIDDVVAERWQAIEARLVSEVQAAIGEMRERDISLILVSNEVGMGVVPALPLGRRFQDMLGRVNQAAATSADVVLLMIAGLPVDLKRLVDTRLLSDHWQQVNPLS